MPLQGAHILQKMAPALLGFWWLLWLSSSIACAQTSEFKPIDITFVANADKTEQRYVEQLPDGFQANQGHDVVIALHGHGADRWQFIQHPRDECRAVRDVASKHKMILVSPDYRARTSWMGPLAEADLLQIIDELKKRHQVGRVFIVGGSMGGTAALTFTALHPDRVDGVCSLNGIANLVEYDQFQEAIQESFGGTKAQVPEEYRKRSAEFSAERFTQPVAVTTGGRDSIVPPESVLRLAATLKSLKRSVLSIHRDQGGHETDYADTCQALNFILDQADSKPR